MRISDWSSDVCSSDLSRANCVMRGSCRGSTGTQGIPVLRIRATFSRISASEADATRGCGSRSHDKRLCRSCTRSEEHTSELQSLMRISYAVVCLKKQNKLNSEQQHRNRPQSHNETLK